MIKYISPSQLKCFEENPENYYLRYLAADKPPREPQNEWMARGSAFDAYVKDWMNQLLELHDPENVLDKLLASQVEVKSAIPVGAKLFENYRASGALASLFSEIGTGIPRMEARVDGVLDGVPIMGKPDLRWGVTIHDWKVTVGSPKQGFMKSWMGGMSLGAHKLRLPGDGGGFLEDVDFVWADQTIMYQWCIDNDPKTGRYSIDQVCYDRDTFVIKKVCQFRCRVRPEYVDNLRIRIIKMWEAINTLEFITPERRAVLDGQANAFRDDEFAKLMRM
jgi:hypothetical protein